jgi:hypothetical protein
MDARPIRTKYEGNHTALERTELLAYLADMLSEMQEIATRQGCDTLAGLLALSHAEAQRQIAGGNNRL